jgi:peptide/nickel transport system ATP-binding protein
MARDLPRGEVPDAARPPLGCSFHPRCVEAFGPCGWESRDLRMVLEQRWTTVNADQFARESELVGPVEHFDVAEQVPGVAVLRPGKGTPAEVVSLLESARDADPAEPLWTGVADVRAEEGDVRVQFGPRYEPHLQPVEGSDVRVSCHRYHDPR